MTLRDFAEKESLRLQIYQRDPGVGKPYDVCFEDVEVMCSVGFLGSVSGDGETPEEAFRNYAWQLGGRRIVFDAYGASRRVIQVPIFSKRLF